ncbi:MAG: N-acetylneuraminate synthase family protein, partial [Thermodesulfobacteriota bacterium]
MEVWVAGESYLVKKKIGMKRLSDYGFKTENSVYIVAEIGINHGGNVKLAKQLIDSAVKTGADAVKFQTYITEKRVAEDSPIYAILKKSELPFEVFKELKYYTSQHNIQFFSTPFDIESVDYLESINIDYYKVSSFDVTNHLLLSRIAETGKPIIMSVGMANFNEVEDAYNVLSRKTRNIALLHCISAYPMSEEDANMSAIYTLREKFDCVIGYSDHTNDIQVPLYSVAAGAQIIEKHYRIDADMNCIDEPVSITELQMKKMVEEIRRIEKIFGSGEL